MDEQLIFFRKQELNNIHQFSDLQRNLISYRFLSNKVLEQKVPDMDATSYIGYIRTIQKANRVWKIFNEETQYIINKIISLADNFEYYELNDSKYKTQLSAVCINLSPYFCEFD